MNRSEMIGILNRKLHEKHGGNYIEIAMDCMDIIEEEGMLPPFGSAFKQVDIEDKWGQITGRKEVRVIEPAWEAE